jgi:hypothetical protein
VGLAIFLCRSQRALVPASRLSSKAMYFEKHAHLWTTFEVLSSKVCWTPYARGCAGSGLIGIQRSEYHSFRPHYSAALKTAFYVSHRYFATTKCRLDGFAFLHQLDRFRYAALFDAFR